MKIDDRTMTPEISKCISKSKLNETQQIDQKPPSQDTIVNLSQASKEAQRIREIVLSEPDVREEKVAELKRKIESGEYEINHDAVADRLVNSFIDEIS